MTFIGLSITTIRNQTIMPIIIKNLNKLGLVLANFVLITKNSKKNNTVLTRIPYIYYLPRFCKNKKIKIWSLINSDSKVNIITLLNIVKLGFEVLCINIKAQIIDGSTFEIFKIVLVSFQIEDKFRKTRFFQKTFLLTNINIKIVIKMFFFAPNNANI